MLENSLIKILTSICFCEERGMEDGGKEDGGKEEGGWGMEDGSWEGATSRNQLSHGLLG